MHQPFLLAGIAVFTFFASAFFCRFVREQLLTHEVLDRPNERSMHTQPCPRGGGMGIWLAVLPAWMLLGAEYNLETQGYLYLGAALLIGVSWLDDRKPLPALPRLGAQGVAVLLGLCILPVDREIFGGILPFWIDRGLAALAWLWFINLTNFMDGADGLSGVQAAHTGLGFVLVVLLAGLPLHAAAGLAAAITGGCLGFLVWNWPKAKLFMGDVGSVPLGYLLGYLMILLAAYGYPAIALALPLYYLADATITLLRRMAEGKKFWQAHREHFYQKAAMTAGHRAVLYPVMIANLLLLLIAVASIHLGAFFLLPAPLIVGGLLWYLRRLSTRPAP